MAAVNETEKPKPTVKKKGVPFGVKHKGLDCILFCEESVFENSKHYVAEIKDKIDTPNIMRKKCTEAEMKRVQYANYVGRTEKKTLAFLLPDKNACSLMLKHFNGPYKDKTLVKSRFIFMGHSSKGVAIGEVPNERFHN